METGASTECTKELELLGYSCDSSPTSDEDLSSSPYPITHNFASALFGQGTSGPSWIGASAMMAASSTYPAR